MEIKDTLNVNFNQQLSSRNRPSRDTSTDTCSGPKNITDLLGGILQANRMFYVSCEMFCRFKKVIDFLEDVLWAQKVF